MIRKSTYPIFLLVVVLALFQACVNHDIGKQCVLNTTVSFSNDIKPIITSNCAIQGQNDKCHNGDNGADLNWTVLSNFQQHAQEVKRRIQLPKSNADHMPREGAITDQQIQLIICWVEQGALDN